ncbi:phage tail protein [Burkholderia sp. Ac-20345]|uniref:phage tail sheath subtilisin-like domain-containing protein n=1 Tax=Burkholderia sp. Ac-20345 TaxID=2703891 RepID=UPI00197BAC5A|nr:phage tail sheath subtilisin-like domain-containing protein [Burkholderia sp. Ac-20345]MBN3779921.1 phage tail protein [Burkholderia sp. Ac-20345]
MSYLHGVETIETQSGGASVTLVKTAVIGLIGTAVGGAVNQIIVVSGDRDFAQFGPAVPNATIRAALTAIFDQGPTVVQVINVLDPAIHNTAVAGEALTLNAADTATLAHPGIVTALPSAIKSPDGATTYEPGTDYVLDTLNGIVTRVATGAIARSATLSASYSYADPSQVTQAEIIGGIDAAGLRTGMQKLLDGYSTLGYLAKLLIAPVYSTFASVSSALETVAGKIRAISYRDAPAGLTVQQAVEARGPAGVVNFFTSSERSALCYPHVEVLDETTNANVIEPLSARAAGLQALVDQQLGYWFSASNNQLGGVLGLERPIYAMINDPNSDTNLLNAAGIMTIFASYGTGYRLWGNRSAAFPASTEPTQFICVRRTADVIEESLEYFTLQYVDKPISNGDIDAILESANGFLRKLVGDGAIIDGRAWFDPTLNPATELAAGWIQLSYDFMPPPPAERITYQATVNINYLNQLGSTQQ